MSKNQTHMGSVGAKAKKCFDESRKGTKGAIESFLDGVGKGLLDVDKNWSNRSPIEKRKRFDKVFDAAKEIMVCSSDGGGCDDDGLNLSTFNSYKSLGTKVFIYTIRWQLAKKTGSSKKALHIAQKIKKGDDKDFNATQNLALNKYNKAIEGKDCLSEEDKMDLAMTALDEASVELGKNQRDKTINADDSTVWTLPNPDGCTHDTFEDSIQTICDYYQHPGQVQQLNADTPAGRAVRRALSELEAYLKLRDSEAA